MLDNTSSPISGHDDAARRFSSPRSSPSTSRRSSAFHSKPIKQASKTSLRNTRAHSISDSQSLTSFPSLSPPVSNPINAVAQLQQRLPLADKTSRETPAAFNGLFRAPSVFDDRGTLFDDAPKGGRDVPGTIHLQSDEHIQKLVSKMGVVALIKQLAADLAERDAQITRLQNRAEEREGLLKKMLRACEISNIDIETRLRDLDTKKASAPPRDGFRRGSRQPSIEEESGSLAEDSIDGRMSLALNDSLIPEHTAPLGLDGLQSHHDMALIKSNDTSRRSSIGSLPDHGVERRDRQAAGTPSKGWKEYLMGNTGTVRRVGNANSSTGDTNPARHRASFAGTGVSGRQGSGLRNNLNSDSFDATLITRTVSNSSSYRDIARPDQEADTASIRSSSSIASWAMKLVGGSTEPTPNVNSRERAATVSVTSTRNGSPRRIPLTRAKSRVDTTQSGVKGNKYVDAMLSPMATVGLGPSGTIKKASHENARNPLSNMISPANAQNGDQTSNLGPVEMDTIVPEETRPPTLLPHTNRGTSDLLTDRFGFIYDQRRQRRQNEAATDAKKKDMHVETFENHRRTYVRTHDDDVDTSEPVSPMHNPLRSDVQTAKDFGDADQRQRRWQDYLKISSFPTELLSHTPYTAPITSVTTADGHENVDKPNTIVVSKRGSLPSSNRVEASPSRVVSGHAELVRPALPHSGSSNTSMRSQPDPVKSLLDQLTEVHDTLQREKTVKWNDFLRKVRAERNRNGETNTASEARTKAGYSMPETTLTDGELIGIAGLGNRGKVGRAKWSEFRNLVLGGIPVAYRAKIWAECSGATGLRIPGYYEDLVHSTEDDPTIVQQIQMDITRTLTDNIFFRRGPGVEKLKEVLLAYARRNPEIGYCQGMNMITANLLLIMPTTEDAFWILTAMVENILPEKYYDSSLLASRADQVVLRQYVTELLPQLSDHLEELGIELEALTFQWFLSVFTDCLSAEALFRVWDVVLCMNDGASFLFQVALALLKLNEPALLAYETPAEIYGYINQQMTDHAISIDGLIRAGEALKKVVKREEVVERRHVAIEAELELNRQREAIRKGKRRANDPIKAPTTPKKEAAAVESPSVSRKSSYARTLEDEYDEYAELQIRTPMPIDEEIEWRG